MIKAFISHSSAQKEFAQELVNTIGRDYCKIDCFDFEPGKSPLARMAVPI